MPVLLYLGHPEMAKLKTPPEAAAYPNVSYQGEFQMPWHPCADPAPLITKSGMPQHQASRLEMSFPSA